MAAPTPMDSLENQLQSGPKALQNYPVPLSPPLPSISKNIELNRALSASSKSSIFSLNRNDVLFEDEWLIAINKPQGIYCESILSAVPTLLKNDSIDSGDQVNLPELHLANRLDRDTSGVTIITKSHRMAAKLVKAFTKHEVRKTYIARCIGPAPEWENITVRSGHGRSKYGAWRVYAASDVGRKLPGGSMVRDMETLFEVILINGQDRLKKFSRPEEHEKRVTVVEEKSVVDCDAEKDEILLRAYPRSGRTHQIRLHCQYLGIPIRGDVKYEGVYEWNGRTYDGHELHAESLSFMHPVTAQPVLIQAPLPSWAAQELGPGLL
ncbi:RNA pseudouridine synthase 1 [Olea europaea var. sylvestris]|uniref:RNA pseudouridine synthase 1 n=1 Tax=Olea europaea var. sylvestris TaxID=158386 RepID=UPI000C1D4AD6|nr:RNA pseudouridine synthase 1 [Olea europaea var. sylvestris]